MTVAKVTKWCATHDREIAGPGNACDVCRGARHPRTLRSHASPWFEQGTVRHVAIALNIDEACALELLRLYDRAWQ